MTSAIARGFAVAAALAALAACGGGGGGGGTPQDTTTGTAATGVEEEEGFTADSDETEGGQGGDGESDGEVFPGSDTEKPSASSIKLSRTKVGEPVQGDVEVKGSTTAAAKPLQNVNGNIAGEELEFIQKCLGEVPPEGCEVIFQYTPTEPGPYSGELTFTMADGSTVTAPISGEAVGGATSASASPVGPTTTAPVAPTTETETEELPPDVPTDTPEPDDYDLP
ncbi:hypothetical protein [Streptomyces sp. P17]|uniref:hypothetical protein n=1 Tax=Streptomyces sp. P17 TaxID=3074716 RepID=UPI0028F3E3B2|nr:hypothetical protein [Streptomyces sp. P17]MDT9697915.1 hypothetical protein [Streptomyces sp. P17]